MKVKLVIMACAAMFLAACGFGEKAPTSFDVVDVFKRTWGDRKGLTFLDIKNLECHKLKNSDIWECEFDYTKPAERIFGAGSLPARKEHRSLRLIQRDDGSWTNAGINFRRR